MSRSTSPGCPEVEATAPISGTEAGLQTVSDYIVKRTTATNAHTNVWYNVLFPRMTCGLLPSRLLLCNT